MKYFGQIIIMVFENMVVSYHIISSIISIRNIYIQIWMTKIAEHVKTIFTSQI